MLASKQLGNVRLSERQGAYPCVISAAARPEMIRSVLPQPAVHSVQVNKRAQQVAAASSATAAEPSAVNESIMSTDDERELALTRIVCFSASNYVKDFLSGKALPCHHHGAAHAIRLTGTARMHLLRLRPAMIGCMQPTTN